MSAPRGIARLKVTLEDVEPKVMRRLDVPLKVRLDRLHLVLQAAMGWTNSHLYEFTAGGTGWGVPDPDFGDGPLPAAKTTLFDVIEDTGARTIHYLYDYGDGWEHAVRIERIAEGDPQARYPQLAAAEGRCPPEDVGGPSGYAEFLAAIADSTHEDHDHMLRWCGGAFDPHTPTSNGSSRSSIASPAVGRHGRASRTPHRRDPERSRVTSLPE